MPMKEKKPYKGRVITQRDVRKNRAKNEVRTQHLGKSGIKRFVPFHKQ